jgi:hypothetical protein
MSKGMAWFRFYSEFMDDPKISMMSDCDQLIWVKCLCLASESKNRGFVELDDQEICWKLRISLESWKHAVDKFRAKGMIEHVACNKKNVSGYKICNWKTRQFESDCSTPRVQKSRQAKKAEEELKRSNVVTCNVTETPPDTDPDSNTDPESDSKIYIESKPEKIKPQDKMAERFSQGKPKNSYLDLAKNSEFVKYFYSNVTKTWDFKGKKYCIAETARYIVNSGKTPEKALIIDLHFEEFQRIKAIPAEVPDGSVVVNRTMTPEQLEKFKANRERLRLEYLANG